jgi:hypothetical protein
MDDLIYTNGLDATSGSYLLPPLPATEVAAAAFGTRPEATHARELAERLQAGQRAYRVNADTRDLVATGWGVIWAHDTPPAVREALSPLLAHRRAQAGERFKQFVFYPGESKSAFLLEAGVGPGPVVPDKVPYYLLLVGDPLAIPFRFQYELDVQYAVGRLHFDTPAEYASYASSVVAAETGALLRAPRAAFFAPSAADDPATLASATHLATPLAATTRALVEARDAQLTKDLPWSVEASIGAAATKARLIEMLARDTAPALVFSASHGLGFPARTTEQPSRQGALVCAEWPGPHRHNGPIPDDYILAAHDIGDELRPGGTIVFAFACYGAGTPQHDEFAPRGALREIAPQPFLARLPQRLLGHPHGGALAFVGHVDRAWGTSFAWEGSAQQVQVFQDTLQNLLDGQPIGAAMEWFNQRYAELATTLAHELHEIEDNAKFVPDSLLARLWTAGTDARNYVVIGDPAVRLAVRPLAAPAIPSAVHAEPAKQDAADAELTAALRELEEARRHHAESAAALAAAEARVATLRRAERTHDGESLP